MSARLARPAHAILTLILLTTTAVADGGVCFRGKPKPECDSFLITEIGLGLRLADDRVSNVGWPISEIGWMKNVNDRYAIGATSYVTYESQYTNFRGGVKLRARRWLDHGFSLNLSSGIVFLGDPPGPDYVAHVDLNYKDLVAPYVGLDMLSDQTSPLDGPNWHAGLRFGSYGGMGLTGVAVGVFVTILYFYMISG